MMNVRRPRISLLLVSQRGVSIAEVVVAAGILAVIISVLSTVILQMNRQMAWFNTKYDYNFTQTQIDLAFRSDTSCFKNVEGLTFPGTVAINQVLVYDSAATVTATMVPTLGQLPNSRLNITQMVFTDPTDPAAPPAEIYNDGTRREFAATLQVTATHNVDGAPALQAMRIPGIRVVTNMAGTPTKCTITGASNACVTGSYNGRTGATQVTFRDPSLNPADPWTTYFVKVTGDPWGVHCNAAWGGYPMGCTSSQLMRNTATVDATLNILADGSCTTPASSIDPVFDSTIYLTCCKNY